ncbi:hypothetical protein BFJ63_vAg17124 [Fusarium oxysporum f. sp. narcissi]|uniref:Uncharacterized protein n=1 Tax=Fusarium oxysporum f. sp. narcissi TaxID=451672 RepID=A0A4Q2UZG3_FUSOX|nr:hypothetical protein BFJ63_vAg17124 [Fusarium oxysporum f. sp. narcissi]
MPACGSSYLTVGAAPACIDDAAGSMLAVPPTLTTMQLVLSLSDPACPDGPDDGANGVSITCPDNSDDNDANDYKISSYRRGHTFEVIL